MSARPLKSAVRRNLDIGQHTTLSDELVLLISPQMEIGETHDYSPHVGRADVGRARFFGNLAPGAAVIGVRMLCRGAHVDVTFCHMVVLGECGDDLMHAGESGAV